MRVKINTTATDIRLGVRGDSHKCAFARALKRAIRKQGWMDASVGRHTAWLTQLPFPDSGVHMPPRYILTLNQENETIPEFIDSFDTRRATEPFVAYLEIPYPEEAVFVQ